MTVAAVQRAVYGRVPDGAYCSFIATGTVRGTGRKKSLCRLGGEPGAFRHAEQPAKYPVLVQAPPGRYSWYVPPAASPMTPPADISLPMMRQAFTSAVVSDALDAEGYPRQSPRVPLRPLTVDAVLVGRCKTTLWAEMAHPDPKPYELELSAVDSCQPDDVLIAAAVGSLRSGVWGELLSTAARNTGCVGVIVDGAVRDARQMRAMGFPCFARATIVYDSCDRQRVIDLDLPVEIGGVVFSPRGPVLAGGGAVGVVPRAADAAVDGAAGEEEDVGNRVRDAIEGGMKAATAFDTFGVL